VIAACPLAIDRFDQAAIDDAIAAHAEKKANQFSGFAYQCRTVRTAVSGSGGSALPSGDDLELFIVIDRRQPLRHYLGDFTDGP
jgi:hypothetical protein